MRDLTVQYSKQILTAWLSLRTVLLFTILNSDTHQKDILIDWQYLKRLLIDILSKCARYDYSAGLLAVFA